MKLYRIVVYCVGRMLSILWLILLKRQNGSHFFISIVIIAVIRQKSLFISPSWGVEYVGMQQMCKKVNDIKY